MCVGPCREWLRNLMVPTRQLTHAGSQQEEDTDLAGVKGASCVRAIYNLVRQVMVQAAARWNVPVNRIRFIDALRWLNLCRLEKN